MLSEGDDEHKAKPPANDLQYIVQKKKNDTAPTNKTRPKGREEGSVNNERNTLALAWRTMGLITGWLVCPAMHRHQYMYYVNNEARDCVTGRIFLPEFEDIELPNLVEQKGNCR